MSGQVSGAYAGADTPPKQMLSAEDASFRSPMQFGLSRMPEEAAARSGVEVRDGGLPRLKLRPGATRGIAANATKGWGK